MSIERLRWVAAACVLLLGACGGRPSSDRAAGRAGTVGTTQPMTGAWRGELRTQNGSLPFGLEIGREGEAWTATIINGDERIGVTRVGVEGNEFVMGFPHYDSEIRAEVGAGGDEMRGVWRKVRGPDEVAEVPFRARAGDLARFGDELLMPARGGVDASVFATRLRVRFGDSEDDAVGLFEAREGPGRTNVQGTILTSTGDYRYLSGVARGGSFKVSCFDGAHAFLIDASVMEDGSGITGRFDSGNWYRTAFAATVDDGASLGDPLAQTAWSEGHALDEVVFRDLEGNAVRLTDAWLGGRAALIEVMGTWCPNCNDAGPFLQELRARYKDRGLEVVALAFELSEDFERSRRQVERYVARHGIEYPVLIAGLSDKDRASEFFPVLDRVRSYPTTIFMDGSGEVRGIYTGFSGPATGAAHSEMRATFERLIEGMIE